MKRTLSVMMVCALVMVVGLQTVRAEPPQSNPIIHIVQWGENLTSIARHYGTTIQAIVAKNQLTSANRIYAGQRLIIPSAWTPPPSSGCTYVVQYGDTLSSIAFSHGVSIYGIVQANGIVNPNRIYPGQRLVIPCGVPAPPSPAPGGFYYYVRRGDTLAKIGVRFGVSVWTLVTANNIANPNVIYTGQRLYIPKSTYHPPDDDTDTGTTVPGCEHLAWPKKGSQLSGIVWAKGTADHERFGYYKLEYRKDGLDDWHYITGDESPVRNGVLGAWDTRTVSDGPYTFRLVIVDQTGNYPPPCEIAVRVNNDP
jgi:LysM repeat protein